MSFSFPFVLVLEMFLSYIQLVIFGAVAHLVRAIEWHSIGGRFDPDQLQIHKASRERLSHTAVAEISETVDSEVCIRRMFGVLSIPPAKRRHDGRCSRGVSMAGSLIEDNSSMPVPVIRKQGKRKILIVPFLTGKPEDLVGSSGFADYISGQSSSFPPQRR